MSNHNNAAVRGSVSQPITAYVSHLTWQLSMATFLAADGTPVVRTYGLQLKPHRLDLFNSSGPGQLDHGHILINQSIN